MYYIFVVFVPSDIQLRLRSITLLYSGPVKGVQLTILTNSGQVYVQILQGLEGHAQKLILCRVMVKCALERDTFCKQ